MPYDPKTSLRKLYTERRSVALRPNDVQQLKDIAAINNVGISVIIRRAMLRGLEVARRDELADREKLREIADRKKQRKAAQPPLHGKEHEIRRLLDQGLSKTAIARLMGVSRPTLYRFMSKAARQGGQARLR